MGFIVEDASMRENYKGTLKHINERILTTFENVLSQHQRIEHIGEHIGYAHTLLDKRELLVYLGINEPNTLNIKLSDEDEYTVKCENTNDIEILMHLYQKIYKTPSQQHSNTKDKRTGPIASTIGSIRKFLQEVSV